MVHPYRRSNKYKCLWFDLNGSGTDELQHSNQEDEVISIVGINVRMLTVVLVQQDTDVFEQCCLHKTGLKNKIIPKSTKEVLRSVVLSKHVTQLWSAVFK